MVHRDCYASWRGTDDQLAELGRLMEKRWMPTQDADLYCDERMEKLAARDMMRQYGLPMEIGLQITPALVQQYKIALASLNHREDGEYRPITTTKPIWAKYIKFMGKVYIKELSNTAYETVQADQVSVLVHSPPRDPSQVIVYAGYDAWGLRRLSFALTDAAPKVAEEPDIGWMEMALGQAPHILVVMGDVRSLTSCLLWTHTLTPLPRFRVI